MGAAADGDAVHHLPSGVPAGSRDLEPSGGPGGTSRAVQGSGDRFRGPRGALEPCRAAELPRSPRDGSEEQESPPGRACWPLRLGSRGPLSGPDVALPEDPRHRPCGGPWGQGRCCIEATRNALSAIQETNLAYAQQLNSIGNRNRHRMTRGTFTKWPLRQQNRGQTDPVNVKAKWPCERTLGRPWAPPALWEKARIVWKTRSGREDACEALEDPGGTSRPSLSTVGLEGLVRTPSTSLRGPGGPTGQGPGEGCGGAPAQTCDQRGSVRRTGRSPEGQAARTRIFRCLLGVCPPRRPSVLFVGFGPTS